MTDIITRLHTAVITEVNPIDDLTYPTNLGMEAAELLALRKQSLDLALTEIGRLRSALETILAADDEQEDISLWITDDMPLGQFIAQALA